MLSADHESLLATNYQAVLNQVEKACVRAGRDPNSVQLVAVTKTVVPAVAKALVRLGATEFGENRLPTLDEKLESFRDGPKACWHFIGQLQRNKVRRVIERADVIHSVTSAKLLEAIGHIAGELDRKPGIYLQVKHDSLQDDSAKAGFSPSELPQAFEAVAQLQDQGKLKLLGLMAMGPLDSTLSEEQRRDQASLVFRANANLAASLPATLFHGGQVRLSMGMSGDLEQAIAAGATCIRIGSALFQGLPPSCRIAPAAPMGAPSTEDTRSTL